MPNDLSESGQKSIGTREWYDFIGHLADILPGLHLGGKAAADARVARAAGQGGHSHPGQV